MSQRLNSFSSYSSSNDQLSFNNDFNSVSPFLLLSSSASSRFNKNQQHIAQKCTESGRNSVPLSFYYDGQPKQDSSSLSSSAAYCQNSVATDFLRCHSVEKGPFASQRTEQQQQQRHHNQQMPFADRWLGHRWFSQQQIGREIGQNIGEKDGRYRTKQLSLGEEAAPLGGYWPSSTQRTTAPGGRGSGGEGRDSVQRTLKKGAAGGSSAGEGITAWLQRHSIAANRSEQQPWKGKALEEFCWREKKEKRTASDDGTGNEWPKDSNVSRSSAVLAACRRSATHSQLGHSIPNQYRTSTSRLGTIEARQQRAGSESLSINGSTTGGQAKIRRRGSLGSVEQQHTRGARVVNNRETAQGDFLQNYTVSFQKEAIDVNPRHKITAQNIRPLINRSKTLPSIKFEPETQQKSQLFADNFRNSNRRFVNKDNLRSANSADIGRIREEKPLNYLERKSPSRGEKELQEELEKLFEQLGLLDRTHLMANGDLKSLFESMRKQFDLPTKEILSNHKQKQNFGQEQGFCFTTNGAQKTERRQNAYTKPRGDHWLGRSASNNSLAERGKSAVAKGTNAIPSPSAERPSSSTSANGEQQRRQSLPNHQPKYGRNLEHFWQSMVKARAAETSSNKQKLPLGLSAAEKLQGICQLTNGQRQDQSVPGTNMPISIYPHRKYGGVIETVAMRRNNYLMEAARTASPSGTSTPTTNSGRGTPNFSTSRAFKSVSPSVADLPNSDFLDFGTPSTKELSRDRENRKGCGRFPTVTEEEKGEEAVEIPTTKMSGGGMAGQTSKKSGTIIISINQSEQVGNGQLKMEQRQRTSSCSPDNISECSQQSQCSTKPTTLPQPTPKHNLRDKLISAGFPINRQATSFFGGNAKNPFYGQEQPNGQQQQQQNSSAPNFPFTNTVVSRVNLFEKHQQHQHQQHTTTANAAPPSAAVLHFCNSSRNLFEANGQHLDIVNGSTGGNGQLSPRSSVFRTKSVIVFDFDHLGVTKGETEEHKMKSEGKTKEQKPKRQQQGDERKTRINRTTQKEENGREKGAKKQHEIAVDYGIEANVSGDKSPRWCADPNDVARKGMQNRLQWERSKKIESVPSALVQHHQLANGGLITPMVVTSTKLPLAQFVTASVSSIVSGLKPTIYAKKNEEKEKRIGKEANECKDGDGILWKNTRIAGTMAASPRFHFSTGRPVSRELNERMLLTIRELFESQLHSQLRLADFGELCRRMNFAVYSKRAVFDACCSSNGLPLPPIFASTSSDTSEGIEKAENAAQDVSIDFNQFCVYWNRMISEAHDEASRFVFTLSAVRQCRQNATARQQRHILSEDFVPMMMDLILTHPGLHFLKEAPQFYGRYADVVIVRIFWNVNRSWSGKITANELRRSNFLQTLRKLDEVQDINKVTDFFSYEHFYVTYCKFWELDTDHDMIISRDDMRRHCNGALTDRIIDRIFSAAVIRTPPEQRTVPQPLGPIRQQPIETIGFEDFVCFLLAEEDKRHPTSIEYWFRCVDLDGDGQISLYEMEYFYEAIEQKLLAKGMETLALRDVICNLIDSISPAKGHFVTRMDLKRSGLAHRFFNTFVNWIKYVDQESSDGERASVKTNEDKELSDWEMFCLSEYELLMSETEQTSNEGEVEEEEHIDVILDDDEDEEEEDTESGTIGEEKKKNGTVGERGDTFPTNVQRHQTATALT